MQFSAIQTAVIINTFDSTADLTDVKAWINTRYTWLCDLEDWTFMRGSADVTVTSASQTVSALPTDIGIVNSLIDQYGDPLRMILDPEEFRSLYTGTNNTNPGQPEAFAYSGGTLLVGPTSNVTSTTFRLEYERVATLLSADADLPILPSGYHYALVAGARALGCKLRGMLAEADAADSEFRGAIDALRRKYLEPARDVTPQAPAYRPC